MGATAMPSATPPTRYDSFDLPATHAQLKSDADEVAAQFAPRAREVRQHLLEHGELYPQLWAAFRERGWPALLIPKQYGGTEGGLLGLTLALEAFARHNIVLWTPVMTSAVAYAISVVGPEPAQQAWLPRVADGRAFFAMAATEAHSGHNLFRSNTEIRRDRDHFVVTGVKNITSALDASDMVLVLGRSSSAEHVQQRGYTSVLVDPRARGATMVELPMRHREGVKQYQLQLEGVRMPYENLIGHDGQGLLTLWPFTHAERVLTSALCLGLADYAIARSGTRANDRVIAGSSPIGCHQAISHPLAGLYARLASVRLLVYRTAVRVDVSAETSAGEANMAKLMASDLVYDAVNHAMQVFGVDAWDERNGWLDAFLDARLSRSAPVSNEFALNYIATHMLGMPHQQ